MILYRYLKDHYIETLRDERFKVSCAWEFDDKSDCEIKFVGVFPPVFRSCPEIKRTLAGRMMLVDELNERLASRSIDGEPLPTNLNAFRILCFCDVANDRVNDYMWLRYGGAFQGIRLGFEIEIPKSGECRTTDIWLRKVRYVTKASKKNINAGRIRDIKEVPEIIMERLFVKLKEDIEKPDEKYYMENEYRCLFGLDKSNLQKENDIYFAPFSILTGMKLVSIEIGYRMKEEDKVEIMKIIEEKWQNIDISRADGNSVVDVHCKMEGGI